MRFRALHLLFSLRTFAALILVTGLICFFRANTGRAQLIEAARADHPAQMRQSMDLFKQHVRAILRDKCLKCHGGESIKGEFNLATRQSLANSGMVDLKDVSSSHLMQLITHQAEPHMPKDAEKLSTTELNHIRRWLELGAAYDADLASPALESSVKNSFITPEDRRYWAFRPLAPVAPPLFPNESWMRTPIDYFIARGLNEHGLRPNDLADRRRLLRRAYFDLIGLPPPVDKAEQFLNDPDPLAYEKLLDELLQSPHYGKRWARHWMDIARFGESHGYEQDYDRPHAYHYRDFLIKALNQDMPYDQFLRWQLAGDELAPEDPLALMATGFLGAGVFPTQLTEKEFESSRYDELDDMVSTIGSSMLGLSIGCARCHAHKFDPISSSDYYRMAANFATAIRSEIELDLHAEENQRSRRTHEERLAAAVAEYQSDRLESDLKEAIARFDTRQVINDWTLMNVEQVQSNAKTKFVRQSDDSWLAEGSAPGKEIISCTMRTDVAAIAAIRLETLTDASLPKLGPGRADNGNFVLGHFRVSWRAKDGRSYEPVKLIAARATHQQDESALSVAASLDRDAATGWAVDGGGIGADQAAVFELEKPLATSAGGSLKIELVCQHPNGKHTPGRVRLSSASASGLVPSVGLSGVSEPLYAALSRLKMKWESNGPDHALANVWFAKSHAPYRQLLDVVAQLESACPSARMTKVMVTTEGLAPMSHHADGRGFPHFYPNVHHLSRGDVAQKKDVAQPGFVEVLQAPDRDTLAWAIKPPPGWTRTSFRRAGLANWLTDVDGGAGALAARVIVNRLWQHHFGRGIVATPNDFGSQGDRPSHPELLEWLAVDLVQHGWKLKRLHKIIMTSAAYMQSSAEDDARSKTDRENRWLWRFPPRRLEAEAVRDTLLAVSGELDPTMFGPGALDSNMRRRSVYFFIKRSQLIPMMVLFDWPEHQVAIGQRVTTTVAPQALALMNSPQCRQYAEAFAKRVFVTDRPTIVRRAYELALARKPTLAEAELAERFLEEQAKVWRSLGHFADQASEKAAVDFCHTLLAMNELIYVD